MTSYRVYLKSPVGITVTRIESESAPEWKRIKVTGPEGSLDQGGYIRVLQIGNSIFVADEVVGCVPENSHLGGL